MGLFGKRKKETPSPIKELVGKRLKGFGVKINAAWANWMALRTARLTKKGWMTALACFVLLMGSYSAYLIVSAFTAAPVTMINVGNIRKPAHSGNTGEIKAQARISDSEYRRIEGFHRYMDSLAADSNGRKDYESIIIKRPGLMDSIRQVEKYYQQFKNK
ncbi:hypothetical protein [Mucilaginibacter polytrichastri]|uniref:Uncharacterized protein n=1 Tax=Mucilaginibacter polytrichastri TaxID=1302689 RepID=A0A1Q5ZVC6_9SPHI|nr:hypothetical protein [Mucilaginibacter polytrichastri]OKS85683.1 hypothetical protein RG47T_1129 [Mucilaginibacter polytrichastri]SFS62051.1 hypothetical protein SAMN04487890_102448 [Mucilaginibacter polytrichastri]